MSKEKRSGNPFDISEFFKAYNFDALSQMFEPTAFINAFRGTDREIPDMAFVFAANKQRFEAMAQANKAAAESYKAMIAQQMEIFEEIIKPARETMINASDPAMIAAAQDAMNRAVEQALDIMQEMAQTTRTANELAFAAAKEHAVGIVKNAIKI